MSDGPHKSLPMRSAWRRAAEIADADVSTPEDIAPRLLKALTADWKEDVSPGVLAELRAYLQPEQQTQLFAERAHADLSHLENLAAGRPLALVLIEHARQVRESGLRGDAALAETARRALAMHIARGVRQIEEHYLRRSDAARSQNVRARLDSSTEAYDLASYARRVTKIEKGSRTVKITKKIGIDDGVNL